MPNGGPEQRRRLPWQVGGGRGAESGSGGAVSEARGGGGVNLVYMTAPCTTLDSFLENKVGAITETIIFLFSIFLFYF